MKRRLLPFLFLLASCHKGGSLPTPVPEGQRVGNGGDFLHGIFERGREDAAAILDRIPPTAFSESAHFAQPSAPAGVVALLADDVRRSPHVWSETLPSSCPQDTCACTTGRRNAPIFLSHRFCGRSTSRAEVGELLVHESLHHFSFIGASEDKAVRGARLVYSLWSRQGHPDAPHWIQLSSTGAPAPAKFESDPHHTAWTGKQFLVWRRDFEDEYAMDLYSPGTGRWERHVPENRFVRETNRVACGLGFLPGVWADGRYVRIASPWSERASPGVAYDFQAKRWEALSTEGGFPSHRQETQVFSDGRRLIVWGGIDFPTGKRETDGRWYDFSAKRWHEIPSAPEACPKGPFETGRFERDKMYFAGAADGRFVFSQGYETCVFELQANRWHPVPRPPDLWGADLKAVLGKSDLFYFSFSVGGGISSAKRLDLTKREWHDVSVEGAPRRDDSDQIPLTMVGTGSRLIAYGRDLRIYELETNRWIRPDIVTPPNSRRNSVLWTGFELIVWDTVRGEGALFYP